MRRCGLLILLLCLLLAAPAWAERFVFKKGATSQTIMLSVWDSASSTGGKLTGVAYNAAGLTCYYTRVGGTPTAITLATQTVTGAYAAGGWVQVDATNAPGRYRLDIPDAVLATGVDRATIDCKGATNMVPISVDIELVAYDPQSATVTLAAGTHTGAVIPTVTSVTNDVNANMAQACPTTPTAGTAGDACKTSADSTAQTGDAFARLGAPAGASQAADIADIRADIPAALVGGRMDSSVGAMAAAVFTTAAMADGAFTSAKFADGTVFLKRIVVTAGSNTAKIVSTSGFTEATAEAYDGAVIACSTHGYVQPRGIIRFDPALDTVFIAVDQPTPVGNPFSSAPVAGDICLVFGKSR